jgi:predicted transcriptional regulator
MAKEREVVRLSLELSPQANEKLEELSQKIHSNKSDVLRRAITLMEIAVKAREEGKKFGIAAPNQELATEIIGI